MRAGVASFFNMLNTMNAPMRYSANPLNRLRWINMLLLASMVSNIYLFLIPMCDCPLPPAPLCIPVSLPCAMLPPCVPCHAMR